MECEFPSVNSNNEEIIEIFRNTKTIAIAGLSPDSSKASNMVAVYLQNAGFKIVPVYPKEDVILGEKVYRTISEIPLKLIWLIFLESLMLLQRLLKKRL